PTTWTHHSRPLAVRIHGAQGRASPGLCCAAHVCHDKAVGHRIGHHAGTLHRICTMRCLFLPCALTLPHRVAQCIRMCRCLQVICQEPLVPGEAASFSTPWA